MPADAPPLWSVVAQDDILFKVVQGLHVEWSDADRPAELHVFARGAHGFGMVRQGTPVGPLDRPVPRLVGGPRHALTCDDSVPP